MKTQKHNQGELKELKVKIEKEVADSLEIMAQNSKYSVDEIVEIAIKRFRAAHMDYLGKNSESDS